MRAIDPTHREQNPLRGHGRPSKKPPEANGWRSQEQQERNKGRRGSGCEDEAARDDERESLDDGREGGADDARDARDGARAALCDDDARDDGLTDDARGASYAAMVRSAAASASACVSVLQ